MSAWMLIESFMRMMQLGTHSYAIWSACLTGMFNCTVSKQGVWSRMNDAFVQLLKELLQKSLQQIIQRKWSKTIYTAFNRVWIEDSTCVHLPDNMREVWKGNCSRGKQKSVLKIHVVINVLNGIFGFCHLEHFTTNEQALAKKIMSIAQAGDLIIRDMGYFVLEAFEQLATNKIYFLSRKRYGIHLYDAHTRKPVTIRQLVKNKTFADSEVFIGAEQKCKVRLVAVKLSEQQKEARIRKAKTDRDRRCCHSAQYYFELGYCIFITNVGTTIWTYEQVVKAYRVRWNIEILFKCWKSHFHLQNMIPQKTTRTQSVEAVIYLMLLFLTWFQYVYYEMILPFAQKIKVSILKASRYLMHQMEIILQFSINKKQREQLFYICQHEKRNNKSCAITFLDSLTPN